MERESALLAMLVQMDGIHGDLEAVRRRPGCRGHLLTASLAPDYLPARGPAPSARDAFSMSVSTFAAHTSPCHPPCAFRC